MQKKVEQIIREVAKEYNLPFEVVEKVFSSQFKLIKDTAKTFTLEDNDSFKNIRIKHLCLFYTRPRRIEQLKELIASGKTKLRSDKKKINSDI